VHCSENNRAKDQPGRLRKTVRATVVGQDMVLAGNTKMIRLLCNSNLNISIPSRGSEEERIRICLQAWSNIQANRYKK